jgi:hypothetical protein
MKFAVSLIESRKDCFEIWKSHERFLPDCSLYIDTSVSSIKQYNELLTSLEFWNEFEEDYILIIQHDSGILRTGIEEFYEWDYVGAPWKFQEHGGNGGLSWRSKEAMIWCINQKPWGPSLGNEDVYFSNLLKDSPFKLAPREVCERFSCESIYKEGTLGYHAIEKYLTPEQVTKIKTQYE